MRRKRCFLGLAFLPLLFTSCEMADPRGPITINNTVKMYTDNPYYEDEDLNLSIFIKIYQRPYGTIYPYQIYFEAHITNNNEESVKLDTSKMEFTIVKDGIKRLCGSDRGYNVIEPKEKRILYGVEESPYQMSESKYIYSFSYEHTLLICSTDATPEEEYTDVPVTFILDDGTKYIRKVRQGTYMPSWRYVSDDLTKGCYQWSLTEGVITNPPSPILTRATLYGKAETTLLYADQEGGEVYNAFGAASANFARSFIIIPKTYNNKPVTKIVSFSGNMPDLYRVYIPKGVTIESGVFQNATALEHVYYEGSEEEWATYNKNTWGENVEIHFNEYYTHYEYTPIN